MSDLAYLSAMTSVPDDITTTATATSTSSTGVTRQGQQHHSSFRRSLTLSHGAAALLTRGFSRSSTRGRSTSNAAEPAATSEEDRQHRERHQQQPRRATIATPTTDTAATTTPGAAGGGPSLHVRIVPNIENPSRCIIFDIVDREMKAGSVIKIGRFAERSPLSVDHMSFKSKVVSRSHCEIWVHQDGKLYIRDTSSSSGTFLNHIRLSGANQESPATEINHGDIVQLGVDYQGGQEEIYRSVKMRFELNCSRKPRPLSFSMSQFNNLRTLSRVASNHGEASSLVLVDEETQSKPNSEALKCTDKLCSNSNSNNNTTSETNSSRTNSNSAAERAVTNHTQISTTSSTTSSNNSSSNSSGEELPEVDECCICLYALAPFQALFVAPCSHSYHFMCIRTLLQSYPGFQCPICRTYSDLEASVAIEPEEVMQKYGLRCKSFTPPPEAAFEAGYQQTSNTNAQQQQQQPPATASSTAPAAAPITSSIPSPPPEEPPQLVLSLQEQQQQLSSEPPTPATSNHGHVYNNTSPVAEPGSSDDAVGPSTRTTPNSGILVSNGSSVRDATARDRRTVFVSDDMDVIEIPPAHQEEDPIPEEQQQQLPSITPPPTDSTTTAAGTTTPSSQEQQHRPIRRSARAPASTAHPERRLSAASHLMEKLKMTFFEKRKSSAIMSRNEQQRGRKRSNKPRPLSYPNFLIRQFSREEEDDVGDENTSNNNDRAEVVQPTPSSSSSSPPSHPPPPQPLTSQQQQQQARSQSALSFNSLSRQSTTHLSEIQEEPDSVRCQPAHEQQQQQQQQQQPMAVDT
ncbi:hypothetical protein BDB00DRAFT_845680 [Zychaea mexicana]|uniref:uncharacterized protein n=1 Tax=Zychaea mexicana TaxID=64656 RepID=UPI0022FDEC74|nr:uncharacterized protein BDB00DRAFT_845680 [Zychaea mexicana]KAI9489000.1 hypothetical protein BDB00DRAFT_845680 [Zychaea mexicana]